MFPDSCPIVLADDPAYFADDPLACAGSVFTTDIGLPVAVIPDKPTGR